jgi:hypothetical protein
MKNLFTRFIMAALVTGFTYTVFVSGTFEITSEHRLNSALSFELLIADSKAHTDSTENIEMEEPLRKLNYASFRKSLIRHRSIYYANQD